MTEATVQPIDELRAVSRVTGADVLFLHLVHLVASKHTGSEALRHPIARERIEVLHEEFRGACAAIFEKHLGRQQALESLNALESASLQRYLAARQAMAPSLAKRLAALKHRMGSIEV